ncbi:hypothetical protein [Inconstantimicrobium mannanitabidum]|uniref:Uncharacterized protein n=1 Tax=Inconstantimicrobium mannanitabidum TaxID=1604901 RepID=A0ACB5RFN4_9CLOT|nr:hypothetical protein [Clostridium sp. TW13]GKX67900.1 hypothetical protein rsdtw13_31580 [Clostridium sp. TW13]
MLLKVSDATNTYTVESVEELGKMIKSGKVNKDSRVFDAEAGEYRALQEIKEVKEFALYTEYNKYLCMDAESIELEKKRETAQDNRYKIVVVTSLTMLIISVIINIINLIRITSIMKLSAFSAGAAGGAQLFRWVIMVIIWIFVKNRYQKNHGKIAAVILILLGIIYIFMAFISFQIISYLGLSM